MTTPLSTNRSDPFPIEVTENQWQFMVRIPPSQKERASRITGRRWNPEIGRWVYPRTIQSYEALTEEFKRDASCLFEISKPPSRRLPKPESKPHEDDQSLEEWKDLNEKTSEIHEKFNALDEQISSILGAVRTVEDLTRETQDLVKARPESHATISHEPPARPHSLDLAQRDDLKVMQKALALLASAASGHDQSFAKWLGGYQPLLQPYAFVAETHEKLKASIGDILGEPDYEPMDFIDLVYKLKTRNVMNPRENKRIGNLLFAMNQHRNRFGHPIDFEEPERLTRSIIYLFNLALVWPHVASEPVEESDET